MVNLKFKDWDPSSLKAETTCNGFKFKSVMMKIHEAPIYIPPGLGISSFLFHLNISS